MSNEDKINRDDKVGYRSPAIPRVGQRNPRS